MVTFLGITLTISVMVFATAFYVAAEFGSISARKTRILQQANEGSYSAKLLLPILESNVTLDKYVATSQVGISISSLILGAYGQNTVAPAIVPALTRLGLDYFTEAIALSISVTGVLIFLTILQVIMGELIPKSLTIQFPERVAMLTVVPMVWSMHLFHPLIWIFNGSAIAIARLFGVDRATDDHSHAHSAAEIELLVSESHEGGLLDDQSQQMLRNALRLRKLTARQVMVPRTQLVAASINSTVTQIITIACAEGYTRIPLYQGTIDNIVGFVHLKDLFRLQLQGQDWPKKIVRAAEFVPEGVSVARVWATLNKNRRYLAIVLDEYGGTAGLLTIEDLVEEIFGELLDEFDDELPVIASDKNGRLHLRSDLLISDINEYLALNLPLDDAETLGGLMFNGLGHVPRVGDEITVGEPPLAIRVEAMEGLHVLEVSLKLPGDILPYVREWAGGG
jgi:CBS domain containing-hemolysin-like protein